MKICFSRDLSSPDHLCDHPSGCQHKPWVYVTAVKQLYSKSAQAENNFMKSISFEIKHCVVFPAYLLRS